MEAPPSLAPLQALLRRHFGYAGLRPLQARVVAGLDAGRDVLAVLPTGAGKSICFQLPPLLGPGPPILVSPPLSLLPDPAPPGRGSRSASSFPRCCAPAPRSWSPR